jgi:hypothetical protein
MNRPEAAISGSVSSYFNGLRHYFPSRLGRLIDWASARPNHLGVTAKAPEQQDTKYLYV